jgi:hypothetical protein
MFLAGLIDWLMQEKGLCLADTWGDCKMWGEKSGLLKSKNRFRTVCSNYRHSHREISSVNSETEDSSTLSSQNLPWCTSGAELRNPRWSV